VLRFSAEYSSFRPAAQRSVLAPHPRRPDGLFGCPGSTSRPLAWLGYADAIRESTADWDLPLLLQASVEHLGYSP
jgi:hypothetical protein